MNIFRVSITVTDRNKNLVGRFEHVASRGTPDISAALREAMGSITCILQPGMQITLNEVVAS